VAVRSIEITGLHVDDVRFPTSETLAGSDAMNVEPDYSCAYITLTTSTGATGNGLAFTLGRGTELVAAAIETLRHLVVGATLDRVFDDMAGWWRSLVHDGQMRWLGPEKGVTHLAVAAVVNAVWDLRAKVDGLPLWLLLCEMPPEQLVSTIDFRYIDDLMTPAAAVELLQRQRSHHGERVDELTAVGGYPAYTTSVGWLGYDDATIEHLTREAVADGWSHVKMKVGGDPDRDLARAKLIRSIIGPERSLMMDANQKWGVDEAIERMGPLAEVAPRWIEEPTHPDDVVGHATIARAIAPIAVATGEAAANRVIFKQLLQLDAIEYVQIDSCRLAGVNEVVAVLLMAASVGKKVCPHAGGVGLCEHVQHLAVFDHVALAGDLTDRTLEYVDHLHEHFVDPCLVRNGRYVVPERPGYSIEMRPESIARFRHV
jgi:L-fuconate dehydratase